jgi:hypothetical protein
VFQQCIHSKKDLQSEDAQSLDKGNQQLKKNNYRKRRQQENRNHWESDAQANASFHVQKDRLESWTSDL